MCAMSGGDDPLNSSWRHSWHCSPSSTQNMVLNDANYVRGGSSVADVSKIGQQKENRLFTAPKSKIKSHGILLSEDTGEFKHLCSKQPDFHCDLCRGPTFERQDQCIM